MNPVRMKSCICSCIFLLLLHHNLVAQIKTSLRPVAIAKIPKQPKRPDTLNFGHFILIVTNYDSIGSWDPATLTFQHMSGIGKIRFGCQHPIFFLGKIPTEVNRGLLNVDVSIVNTVRQPSSEISVQQARQLGISGNSGDIIQLKAPASEIKSNINLAQLLKKGITLAPPGETFRFSDVEAVVKKIGGGLGLVKAGSAIFPSTNVAATFILNVSPGFQLEVSNVVILPNRDAETTARLLLPPSLSGTSLCQNASLDLGLIRLSNACEFYKELPDSLFGSFGVGNTTLVIHGKGYVVDFSSTQTYSGISQPVTWKGVVLMNGTSPGTPGDTVLSNTGYLQGDYSFSNALVVQPGLAANFNLIQRYTFGTTQPLGYRISFDTARILIDSTKVKIGLIRNASVLLPAKAAVALNGSPIKINKAVFIFEANLDLLGEAAVDTGASLWWGDLVKAGGGLQKSYGATSFDSATLFYFSAIPKTLKFPISAGANSIFDSVQPMTLLRLDTLGMQGATFTGFRGLIINTPQSPGPFDPVQAMKSVDSSHLEMVLAPQRSLWLNVGAEGIQCNIHAIVIQTDSIYIGNPSENLYNGVTPFTIIPANYTTKSIREKNFNIDRITLQCIESAVVISDFTATIQEKAPTGGKYLLTGMDFTSTGNIAGGQVGIGLNDSLSYWGLKLVAKPGFTSAGVVSARTGEIILTASGLSESRHFSQPFWLTWGEILANGSVGRLFFDYNSAGQQFEHFNFVPTAVALSAFSTQPGTIPYLHVGGNIHFPFFGGDSLNIEDEYTPSLIADPNDRRTIELVDLASPGFTATGRNISGNWLDGLAIFQFTIFYDSVNQDGFTGTGNQ